MKHTKGLWTLDQYSEQVFAGNYSRGTLKHICNVFDPIPIKPSAGIYKASDYRDERISNAHLIAAAPEMLDVLIKLRNEIVSHGPAADLVNLGMIEQVLYKIDPTIFNEKTLDKTKGA